MKIKRLPKEIELRIVPEVGSKILSARMECGMSQKELAVALGLKTAVAISLYETNKREISAIRLWQVARITNLPITHFL